MGDRSRLPGCVPVGLVGIALLTLTGVCVLLGGDGAGDPTERAPEPRAPARPQKRDGAPGEFSTGTDAEQLDDPRVRMSADWPPFGARDVGRARKIAAAIVRYLPSASMSDAEKSASNKKYRAALRKAEAQGLPFHVAVEVLEEKPDLYKIKVLAGEDAGREYWTPRRTVEGYAARSPEGETLSVEVEVALTKPNGKAWDARKGAPDIAVCTELSDGLHCFPGDVSPADLAGRACEDAFACRIAGVRIPQSSFRVVVVDVDLADHDPIAGGLCSRGEVCDLGAATVSVSK